MALGALVWAFAGGAEAATPRPRAAAEPAPEADHPDPPDVPDGAGSDENQGDAAPAEQRTFRGPTHRDCDHRVPLWEHTVQAGEHLGAIAGRYGVRRSDLAALNPQLANPDLIHPGQTVRVCPEIFPHRFERVTYEVRPGDTVGGIASAHGLTVDELVAVAGLRDPNRVRVGQRFELLVDRGVEEMFLPAPRKAARSRVGTATTVMTKLAADQHVFLKRPHLAYGTTRTIGAIERAIAQYKRRYRRGPKVHIGDISKRGGGSLYPHLSHREGRDVDVGYVLKGADADRTRFSGVNLRNLDVARTWALVQAFLDTDEVRVIFMDYGLQAVLYEHARSQGVSERELDELFQYPRGRGRSHGIIRHWRSHKHHFHVRFR